MSAHVAFECKLNCSKVGKCKCADRHQCLDDCTIKVGHDDGAYERLVGALRTMRVGTMARATVVNPMHPHLPRIVVLFSPTCNAFTAASLSMCCRKLQQLYDAHLEPVLGSLTGHIHC
jgi:hypothetical protein